MKKTILISIGVVIIIFIIALLIAPNNKEKPVTLEDFSGERGILNYGGGNNPPPEEQIHGHQNNQGVPQNILNYMELVSNTDDCLGQCEAVIKLKNPLNHQIVLNRGNFRRWFRGNNTPLVNVRYLKWVNSTKEIRRPIYSTSCTPLSYPNGTNYEVCSQSLDHNEIIVVDTSHWTDLFKDGNIRIPSGKSLLVKIKANKRPMLGRNAIDWKFEYEGIETPWAWFDSNWQRKIDLNITPTTFIPNNATIRVVDFDSRTNVQSDCDDVRIVWNNTLEIDRRIFNCGTSNTTITFPVLNNMSSGIDNNSYSIYYDYSLATNPPLHNNTRTANVAYDHIDSNKAEGNVLGYYKFNETSGEIATDLSGNASSTLRNRNSAVWRSNGCRFNEDGCAVMNDVAADYFHSEADMTSWKVGLVISYWIQITDDTQNGHLLSKMTTSVDADRWENSWSTTTWQRRSVTGTALNVAYNPPNGTWIHVEENIGGSSLKVYFNGQLNGSSTGTSFVPSNTHNILLGAMDDWDPNATTEVFPMVIDELRILTQDTSTQLPPIFYNEHPIITLGNEQLENAQLAAQNLNIIPNNANISSDLNATWNVFDTHNSTVNTSITWYNATTQIILTFNITDNIDSSLLTNQTTTLANQNTSIGENWTISVQLYNDTTFGPAINFTSFVENTAPTIPTAISPANNTATAGAINLSCSGSTDLENDTIYTVFTGDTSTTPTTQLQNTTSKAFTWTGINATSYWNCKASDGLNNSAATDTRAVTTTILQGCGGSNSTHGLAYNFSFLKEEGKSIMFPNNNMTVDAQFIMYTNDISINSTIGNQSINQSTGNFLVCITPIENTFQVDAYIDYVSNSLFDKRQYYLINNTASNKTQNISAYSLEVSFGTQTTIRVRDEFFNGVPNAIVFIERYYPEDAGFRTVAMARTDDNGEDQVFLRHLVPFYRYTVIVDGVVRKTTSSSKIITAVGDTTVVTINLGGEDVVSFINNIQGIDFNMRFDNISRAWIADFADTNNVANNICMEVRDLRNNTKYCNDCINTQTGTLTCSVGSGLVSSTATLYGDGSPLIVLDRQVHEEFLERIGDTLGETGLFLGALFIGFMFFAAVGQLITGILLSSLGVFSLYILGMVNISILMATGLLAIVFLIVWKARS